ncbi:AAA family ATPase [Nonomuraea sp. FMUSA5-5]|uniref:AAA family ATPase n=1 Tax=Nonomuraea composti TaxID=2720023 RepID=A0ABX1B4P6_9ACTN|nr:AAA family ATPase [Nonomuraea sp. FMUSA5-5]
MLYGRGAETERIDRLLAQAVDGRSGALVLRGPAGIGKSALLEHAERQAAAMGVRTLRGVGIESETELVFAALHLLLRTGLDRLDRLPAPQAGALAGAFGLAPATAADRFLVGLGALTLLAELAGDGPLLCLVDDAQWLDRSSADALLFAARRLEAEGIVLILAVRDGSHGFRPAGLPELRLGGLGPQDAARLLGETAGPLAPHVRDRVLAESEGNPLALIELPAALTPEQRAGQVTPLAHHLGPLPLTGRMQEAFQAQIHGLPEAARTLLLVAAAESTGDLAVILAAAQRLGAGAEAVEPGERGGLVHVVGGELVFRHPLIRAAAYQGAPFTRRLAAHRALATVLADAANSDGRHADARAWHRAAACTEPDESVAAELEQAAERARRRSGHAATTAAYQRAAQLTPEPRDQVRRLVSAAEAAMDAGQLLQSRALADRAAVLTEDRRERARIAGVRAAIEFEQGSPRVAHGILMAAAGPIADEDPDRTASMLLEAVRDAWFAGAPELARQAVDRLHALGLPPGHHLQSAVSALTGLADLLAGDPARGLVPIHAALAGARHAEPGGPGQQLIMASMAFMVGDDEIGFDLATRLTDHCRAQGLIGWLPHALQNLASTQLYLGRFQDARASADEAVRIAGDIGQHHRLDHLQGVLAWLAAVRGDERACTELVDRVHAHATGHDNVSSLAWTLWARGLLAMGQGRMEAALEELTAGLAGATRHQLTTTLTVPDLVEAAVRCERAERAEAPLARFEEWATATGQPWARAVALRCKALIAGSDEETEARYTEAVSLHLNGGRPFEEGRTRLLFGEWLRRSRRKAEARVQLRQALDTFDRAGALPWAERARAELRATGEASSMGRAAGAASLLTAQELQIVRLAAQGGTNRDIGARLFLSPRTVGYHLHKAFPKLGVASRAELARLDLGI